MKNKTALEIYIEELRKEYGESVFRNCSPLSALLSEKNQLHNSYVAGMKEQQDLKLQTSSQYALDYIYRTYS